MAVQRHRDGMSCKTVCAFNFDANGRKRWCVDCGAELGEQAWHPNGDQVPHQFMGAALAVAALVVLLLFGIWFCLNVPVDRDPTFHIQTPTTYGPPSWKGQE
jgi:hypothetical protein